MYEVWTIADAEAELIAWRRGPVAALTGKGVPFWALAQIVKAQAGILETGTPGQAELGHTTAGVMSLSGAPAPFSPWIRPRPRLSALASRLRRVS